MRSKNKIKCHKKQGWIHGNPVADVWAGAVMRKPLKIHEFHRRMDGRTQQGVESRARDEKEEICFCYEDESMNS